MDLPEELNQCVAFHGHLCPGVVIGYRAAKIGMCELSAQPAGNEELIAIVENDSCAADGVQVLTGCTFGKGNLFFKDHGKMVFTFALRPSGKAVRISLNRSEESGEQEPDDPQERRNWRIQYMLRQPADELFSIRQETIALPETARIHESAACERCGEMVMETRTRRLNDSLLCIPCAESNEKKG